MMIYGKPPRRWPKVLLVIVIVLIVVCCIRQFACGGILPSDASQDEQQQTEQATEGMQESEQQQTQQTAADIAEQEAENGTYQEGVNTTITVSAVGDCTLGTDIDFDESTNFTSVYKKQNDAYFFKKVKKFTGKDDLTLANLEGPLTDSDDIQEKSYNFKGPASYAKILTSGSVEAVNLANNHSFDYGKTGYEDTKKALKKYKVTNFGFDRTATYEANGIKIGLFGINQLSANDAKGTMKDDIAALKKDGCALIIGMFHWGVEGDYVPSSEQVSLAHVAIDNGVDLVIGGHPHVLQGVEVYKDRYICYSMGNFVFGGNSNPKDTDTMIFQQTFTFENGWLKMDDSALQDASVVPCSLTSSSSGNNYQPQPLTGSKAASLLKKLNSYSSKLKGESVSFSTKLNDSDQAQVK